MLRTSMSSWSPARGLLRRFAVSSLFIMRTGMSPTACRCYDLRCITLFLRYRKSLVISLMATLSRVLTMSVCSLLPVRLMLFVTPLLSGSTVMSSHGRMTLQTCITGSSTVSSVRSMTVRIRPSLILISRALRQRRR